MKKILIDNCLDFRLKYMLKPHDVRHARDMGWHELSNGKLIRACVDAGIEILVTVDQSLMHQQNLGHLKLDVITLMPPRNRMRDLQLLLPQLLETIEKCRSDGTSWIIAPESSH